MSEWRCVNRAWGMAKTTSSELVAEVLYPLAETIFQEKSIPSLLLSSSETLHFTSNDDEILSNLLETFILTLPIDKKSDSSPTSSTTIHNNNTTSPLGNIKNEMMKNKEKYLQLLKLFITKIMIQNYRKSSLFYLPNSILLGKKVNFLSLFSQLKRNSSHNLFHLLCFSLRNSKVYKLKDICTALFSIPHHSYHHETSQILTQMVTCDVVKTEKMTFSFLSHLACLHAYLIVTNSLSPYATPSSSFISPVIAVHTQHTTFLTLIAFVATWSSYFQPPNSDSMQTILLKTQSLFNIMNHNLSKDHCSEETDTIAIFLIRKWLQSQMTSVPAQKTKAAELLKSLIHIETSYYGRDCPRQLLNTLSINENSPTLRWETLLSRADVAEIAIQRIRKLVTRGEVSLENDHEIEELNEGDAGDGKTQEDNAEDQEVAWRSILRGKKALNTKEKRAIEEAELEKEIDENNESDKGEEEIGFVLDTQGDHSIIDSLEREEKVTESSLIIDMKSMNQKDIEPVVVVPSSEKKSKKKRKDTPTEAVEVEVAANDKEIIREVKEDEGKTRKSKRTRK